MGRGGFEPPTIGKVLMHISIHILIKKALPPSLAGDTEKPLGNDLLSQEVALQVPSALTGLTAGFGMLPGVPPSLQSPRDYFTS